MAGRVPLSVLILAKNEEQLIGRCLDSVAFADDVVVVDSGSTDATRAIAASHGARVVDQEWLGWAKQRVASTACAAHDWVLFVDSDEVVTPTLAHSIQHVLAGEPDPRDGYFVDRRGDFLGGLLPNESRRRQRRATIRMFNRKYGAWDESMRVHEVVRVPGHHLPLEGLLLHWRGYAMDDYIPVFTRYATEEALALNEDGVRATWGQVLGRPVGRFLWCYLRKGEFRLGTRGVAHAYIKAFSEFARYAKLWELQHRPPGLDPPEDVVGRSP
jgi:glycosyltransferase involved in cell wall biosynthesis